MQAILMTCLPEEKKDSETVLLRRWLKETHVNLRRYQGGTQADPIKPVVPASSTREECHKCSTAYQEHRTRFRVADMEWNSRGDVNIGPVIPGTGADVMMTNKHISSATMPGLRQYLEGKIVSFPTHKQRIP